MRDRDQLKMDRVIDQDGKKQPPRGVATTRLREMLEIARVKGGLSVGEALEAMGQTSIAFTILFQAPRRDAPWITLLCAASYLGGTLGDRLGGPSAGAFSGALVAGLGSSVYARLADRPAVVTRVPAMTMLVPGSIGFLSVSSLLVDDALSGVQTAARVALVAVSLTAGLLTAAALLPPRRLL